MIQNTKINDCNVVIYTPDNMAGKLPALVFIPGNGEVGTDSGKLYVNGPLKFIKEGWKPNFIVVGVQPKAQWPLRTFLHPILVELQKSQYNISTFSLTGLSAGASCLFDYMRKQENMVPIKSVVPMSITIDAQCGDFYKNTDYLCGTDDRYKTTAAWGLCGSSDSHHNKMKRFFQRLIEAGYSAKWTSYSGGHCCWNTYYDPKWKQDNQSIYDFALGNIPVPPETTTTTTSTTTTTTLPPRRLVRTMKFYSDNTFEEIFEN